MGGGGLQLHGAHGAMGDEVNGSVDMCQHYPKGGYWIQIHLQEGL